MNNGLDGDSTDLFYLTRAQDETCARAKYRTDAQGQNIRDVRIQPHSKISDQVAHQHQQYPLNVYTQSYRDRTNEPAVAPGHVPPERSNRFQHQSDLSYVQSKRGIAVEQIFKSRKFTGGPTESISNLLHDYEVCAFKQNLSPD